LLLVRRRIREALHDQPPGPVRVLSMCAGQGRDLIGALAGHPRRADVRARLVELDPRNADRAWESARSAGLAGVDVVTGDAGVSTVYEAVVGVHIALVCGVFGNITDTDIRHTITELPRLCAPGATVIWTRHREPPDLTPTVRAWFAESGFAELAFDSAADTWIGVGTHRLTGPALPYLPDVRLFEFVGY
jgi:ACT domain-containing protein